MWNTRTVTLPVPRITCRWNGGRGCTTVATRRRRELELESSARKKAALAQRVAVLEAEDEKQRLRHSVAGNVRADSIGGSQGAAGQEEEECFVGTCQ